MSTHIPPKKQGSNLIPKKKIPLEQMIKTTKLSHSFMVPSLSVARLSAVPLKPLPSLPNLEANNRT